MESTRSERKSFGELKVQLDSQIKTIATYLRILRDPGSWENLRDYLESWEPDHLDEMEASRQDRSGWQTVDYDRRPPLEKWLTPQNPQADLYGAECRPLKVLQQTSLQTMNLVERQALYYHWCDDVMERTIDKAETALEDFQHTQEQTRKCNLEQDLRCLKEARVVGVTTTGLAKNIKLLRRLPSKVLVCEEAGEVLEAHMLTALLPSLQQCIFIGDHEQLRPQIQNYELQVANPRGKQYSLDVSLFERLVKPLVQMDAPVQFSSLEIQRRMHPSISDLIRSTLYPDLKDHESVSKHEAVTGVQKRLFWFDHNHLETESDVDTSHTNMFEVEMTAGLVSHLVRQGCYQSEDIVVLTPYLGQLLMLRRHLASRFEIVIDEEDSNALAEAGMDSDESDDDSPGVSRTTLLKALRISTVDNFQGEEAKVVVISLVRSNKDKKCGFLRTTNRINVLLR